MPTKPNKAGQQQPYVPQGNGDASGEYADNASKKEKEIRASGNWQKQQEFGRLKWEFQQDVADLKNQNISSEYENEYVKRYNKLAGTNFESKREIEKDMARSYNYDKYKFSNEVRESLKKEGIRKFNVSEYGATNSQEFCAECFSAYYTGMNNELANKFVERVKKFYDDVRRFQ